MKKLILMLAVFAMAGLVVMNSCSSDDTAPTPLSIASLMANDKDINGATSVTDVPTNGVIIATFNTDIDAATASAGNVTLVRTFDGSAVDKDINVAGKVVTITPKAPFFEGDQYKVGFTTGLKSTEGQPIVAFDRTFGTVGIGIGTAPKASNQYLYVQFSGEVVDLTGNAEESFSQVSWGSDRFGNANSAAKFNGQTAPGNGDIVELSSDKFVTPSMTLSVWFYIDQNDYKKPAPDKGANKPLLGLAGNNAYMIEIGDGDVNSNWIKLTTNHKVDPDPADHKVATQWGDFGATDDGVQMNTLLVTGWHHLVMTFDAASYTKTDYLDGAKIKQYVLLDTSEAAEWNLKDMLLNTGDGITNKLALGYFASRDNTNPDWAKYPTAASTFKGMMDDLRLFDVALTGSEVSSLYNAEKP